MSIDHKLPPHLEARVRAFKDRTAEHSHLKRSYDAVRIACSRVGSEKVVIVTGPTGVGKSTLARKLYRELRDECKLETDSNPDSVPVLGMSAVPTNSRVFSWKDFYIRMLFKARDPITNVSLLSPNFPDLLGEVISDSPADRMIAEKLRRCAETALKRRKTRWLLVDEGHHILLHKDPFVNQIQFETLKSLAIETNVTIILVGTYKLLDIRDQSGQLIRRSDTIHFPRYDMRVRDDQKQFRAALLKFEKDFDLVLPTKLMPDWERYFIKSIGCIGILKEWLIKSYAEYLRLECTTPFNIEFALPHALDNKALMTIAKEACEGEDKLKDIDEDSLKDFLVPKPVRAASGGINADLPPNGKSCSVGAPMYPPKVSAKTEVRRRIGERNPKRDPVGGMDAAAA